MRDSRTFKTIAAALLTLALLASPARGQARGGSDPGLADFEGVRDLRRLPGDPPARIIPLRPFADPARILSPAAHLQRFPPPPNQPAFPPTFTIGFPSLRDSYYPDLFRDQAGQAARRTRANRLVERRVFQR